MTRELVKDGEGENSAEDVELRILDDDQRRSAQFLRDSSLSKRVETDRDTTE